MSGNLLNALRSTIVVRELDLSELDPAFVDGEGKPLTLSFRANLTCAQDRKRWELQGQAGGIQKRLKRGEGVGKKSIRLDADLLAWQKAWREWWTGVLMCEQDGIERPEPERPGWFARLLTRLLRRPTPPPEPTAEGLRFFTRAEVDNLAGTDLWEHITTAIFHLISEYQVELATKAAGLRGATSEGPAANDPVSSQISSSAAPSTA